MHLTMSIAHPYHQLGPGHSLKKVAGRPLADNQVSGDKVCSWSVVHVGWEIVEDTTSTLYDGWRPKLY